MTYEKAKRIIDPKTTLEVYAETEYYRGFNGVKQWKEDVDEACELAATALEKRIAKKPTKAADAKFYVCPDCKRFIRKNERSHGKQNIPFCKWCGQALDWEE